MTRLLVRVYSLALASMLLLTFANSAHAGDPSLLLPGPAVWAEALPPTIPTSGTNSISADVNGDSRSDAIAVADGTWRVALSTGSGFSAATTWATGLGAVSATSNYLAGDVTGDGKADAVVVSNGTWTIARSNGSAFIAPTTWAANLGSPISGWTTQVAVADVSGDGRADAIAMNKEKWMVAKSSGSNFSAASSWGAIGDPAKTPNGTITRVADVNGDQKADAVGFMPSTGDWHVGLSTGTAFAGGSTPGGAIWRSGFGTAQGGVPSPVLVSDVDGDGTADALTMVSNDWKVALSTAGAGFSTPATWSKSFKLPNSGVSARWMAGDASGDGKTDLLSVIGSTWYVAPAPPIADQVRASGSGWTTQFLDDFSGSTLDLAKWKNQRDDRLVGGHPYNGGEGGWYLPANNAVSGGLLSQSIRLQSVEPGYSFTAASINTHYLFEFTYGFIEARIRVPSCSGCWPAFWLLPIDNSWPPEIDIMEYANTATLPFPYSNSVTGTEQNWVNHSFLSGMGTDYTGSFHTYGMLWTPTLVQIFVDGIAGPTYTGGEVPHQAMYPILAFQQGAQYITPDGVSMQTDYVQVLQ